MKVEDLPEWLIELAKEEHSRLQPHEIFDLSKDLDAFFIFSNTRQGHDFWRKISYGTIPKIINGDYEI